MGARNENTIEEKVSNLIERRRYLKEECAKVPEEIEKCQYRNEIEELDIAIQTLRWVLADERELDFNDSN